MSTENLSVLALRVFLGEIREWLRAECNLSKKRRDSGKEVRCLGGDQGG